MQTKSYDTPAKLLSSWITETAKQQNPIQTDHHAKSPAAEFLAQVILLCCLEEENICISEERNAAKPCGDDHNPWNHGFVKIVYKLASDKSKILSLKVVNGGMTRKWILKDDFDISATFCCFLSNTLLASICKYFKLCCSHLRIGS